MFCRSCGKPIDDDSKFCPFCGTKVANDNSKVKEENVPTFIAPTEQIPTFHSPGTSENENKSYSNNIPTFTAPANDIPTFTAPSAPRFQGPKCHYHTEEQAVGRCARCGKPLCKDCCDTYGVSSGEYAGKYLCFDCTQEIVAENIAELNANLKTIKGQFILQIIGMVIGFFLGISDGLVTALIFTCIGGVFLSAMKAFSKLIWGSIKKSFADGFDVGAFFGLIFGLAVIVVKCIWVTVSQTVRYIIYIKKTSGFIESDSEFLEQIKEYMEYTMIRQQNRGVDLETLMQEGNQLHNNAFAQMVHNQGEERAEAYMSQCVTRIAENGEIIRDFPNAA